MSVDKLYIIIATILMIGMIWVNGTQAGTQLVHHNLISKETVNYHEMESYIPCMSERLAEIKRVTNDNMSRQSAVANSTSILKECDIHLRDIGSWLLDKGEAGEEVRAFLNGERFYFGEAMINILKRGLVVKNELGD